MFLYLQAIKSKIYPIKTQNLIATANLPKRPLFKPVAELMPLRSFWRQTSNRIL